MYNASGTCKTDSVRAFLTILKEDLSKAPKQSPFLMRCSEMADLVDRSAFVGKCCLMWFPRHWVVLASKLGVVFFMSIVKFLSSCG